MTADWVLSMRLKCGKVNMSQAAALESWIMQSDTQFIETKTNINVPYSKASSVFPDTICIYIYTWEMHHAEKQL